MNHAPMTCAEFVDQVGAHLEGDLTPTQMALFDAHLAVCPRCRRYLASYKAAVSLVRAAMADSEERGAQSLPEALVKSIMRRHRRRK